MKTLSHITLTVITIVSLIYGIHYTMVQLSTVQTNLKIILSK